MKLFAWTEYYSTLFNITFILNQLDTNALHALDRGSSFEYLSKTSSGYQCIQQVQSQWFLPTIMRNSLDQEELAISNHEESSWSRLWWKCKLSVSLFWLMQICSKNWDWCTKLCFTTYTNMKSISFQGKLLCNQMYI